MICRYTTKSFIEIPPCALKVLFITEFAHQSWISGVLGVKSCGGLCFWNRIWDLGWFWPVGQFESWISCTYSRALPPPKNFNLRILNHFYINQGNAVIFHIFFLHFFSKINKRSPRFILDSKVYNSVSAKMCMLCIALELSCCKKRQKKSQPRTWFGKKGTSVWYQIGSK